MKVRDFICPTCGGRHRLEQCRASELDEPPPKVPLAVPSHNGIYQGPVPVRVLAPGVSGEAGSNRLSPWQDKAAKGHRAQSRATWQRRAEIKTRPNKTKKECPKGHPFDEANTYVNPKGKRECRACRRERSAKRKT